MGDIISVSDSNSIESIEAGVSTLNCQSGYVRKMNVPDCYSLFYVFIKSTINDIVTLIYEVFLSLAPDPDGLQPSSISLGK